MDDEVSNSREDAGKRESEQADVKDVPMMPPSEPPTVVGIGASAGGLKAIRTFIEAIPAGTGITFVVVIHLAPEHESSMAELLQIGAKIPVVQVKGRTGIEPDHVYVIPPNRNIEITGGHLVLTEFTQPRGRRSPIDVFFRTLAEKHPDGVAILFSGGGTDGTIGMKAVKEHGGVLMVQLPEEAEHDQMPRSAIATGLVDFILPAEELAKKLVEIRQHGKIVELAEQPDRLNESDEQILLKILTQIHTRTGHDFSGYKRSTLLRRMARRMRVTSVDSLDAYLDYVRSNPTEATALLKDFLISVTNFFRDPDAFEALAEKVVPKLFDGKNPEDEVRIWVPGCATGEEAYSIAMLLLEHCDRMAAAPGIQVFATDLDEEALGYGRNGRYPDAIATDLSEERLSRFFTAEGSYFRVKQELRDLVLFASHNLLKDPPFAGLDLISSRNLLIYLGRDLQSRVFEVCHYALRPDGYLFLGSSESAAKATELFGTIDKMHHIFRRKTGPSGRVTHLPLQRATPRRHKKPQNQIDTGPRQTVSDQEVHRRALEGLAPPSMLVDSDFNIVHLSETAGRYLRHPGGSATLSIVKIIRDELRGELRAALHEAVEQTESTFSKPVDVHIEGERRGVHMHVRPVPQKGSSNLALVLFLEAAASSDERVRGDGLPAAGDDRMQAMEEELEKTRGRLQTTIEESNAQQEELKAANEELQSINEEYKSTLEELETSQEELQSVNEELKTVNEELKEKVEALSRANDDLKNLMAATEVATLFLDRDARIRRYTEPLVGIFNIMPADEGRPLSHVTHQLLYDDLGADAERVLESLVPLEREVRDRDGRDYLLRIAPYRTTEDRIKGIVLTFVDITRVKEAEEELRRTQERYALLIRSVKEYAIFMIDVDGRIKTWNAGAGHLFGYSDEQVLGEPFGMIFTKDDRSSAVPEHEMETAARDGHAIDERWHLRKDGERFWGSGTLTALHDQNGELLGFAKVLRDNTHRREAAIALEKSKERLRELNEELEMRVEERTSELREAHDRVRSLASDLVKAEQRERHRMAYVLHDDLQQRLYAIQMRTSFLRRAAESNEPEQLMEHLSSVEEWLESTVEQARNLAVDLSPPILKNEGLTEAVGWLATQMKERHGLDVHVKAEGSFYMEDEGMRALLFQIVRELLFNVVKHADIDRATVELMPGEGELVIRVEDEGSGYNPEETVQEVESEDGFGLFHVRDRLNFVGGRLEIDSAPGRGTSAVVYAPFPFK